MLDACEHAADARDGLAVAMGGSNHAEVVGELSGITTAIGAAAEFAGTLSAALHDFADRMGSAAPTPTVMPAVTTTAVPPGRWKGKTAKEHVLNGGEDIGRAPKGRKRMPIRLVDSVEELYAGFAALKVGAVSRSATQYGGDFYEFPDGTTIAFRTHSRSGGENDPTMDLAVPGEQTTTYKARKTLLKIHLDHEGQDGRS
ncbi:hypothetical protein [Allokutzneria sp. NRRL B-24872]|uniref:hypothetical protein n=1 Tax=Allokutzneria sp. NRRL B-24872 TaxID=1137961 RepID=UPI000A3CBF52|nr:hypothetical protein [Allokutzneria sp. NRRL B-24872]